MVKCFIFSVAIPTFVLCDKPQILEMFCSLSSSCCDCRQSPEGGFPFSPAHRQSVCAYGGGFISAISKNFAAFSCSVWTQEGSDLLSMTRSPSAVIVVTERTWRDSVIDAADLWFRGIQVPDAHNTHVPGGHLSVDGSGGHPEPARVWNLWHLLLRCGE